MADPKLSVAEAVAKALGRGFELFDEEGKPIPLGAADPIPYIAAQAAQRALEGEERSGVKLPFDPLTAREALLAIRVESASTSGSPSAIIYNIARLAEAGLDRNGIENFELTDQLADRLAEAHGVLQEIRDLVKGDTIESNPLTGRNPMLDVEIDSALALPPDLETMVERRMHLVRSRLKAERASKDSEGC